MLNTVETVSENADPVEEYMMPNDNVSHPSPSVVTYN
jgi:hypothetical protein